MSSIDSFQARGSLTVSTSSGERTYEIFRIGAVSGSDSAAATGSFGES